MSHRITRKLRILGIVGLIACTHLTARAAPTWIVYDRGGHDNTVYAALDPGFRLAEVFTPPSSPTQILRVQIYTSRFAGAPLEDHHIRIVDASLTTEYFRTTLTGGGSGWQEVDVADHQIIVDGDFVVQWWPAAAPGAVGLGGDSEPGGAGIAWRSFTCPAPDACSPMPLALDFMIRVQVDDCGAHAQTVLGCDAPILTRGETGEFTVPVQVVDDEGPIADCMRDRPLCEVDVLKTLNIDPGSIEVDLETAEVSARLIDASQPGELELVAHTGKGPLPFHYAIHLDPDGDRIPSHQDNCPHWPNPDQADHDRNGRGSACECGDQNADHTVDVLDLIAINAVIFGGQRPGALCDASGDGLCNIDDLLAVNASIFGRPAHCARHPRP